MLPELSSNKTPKKENKIHDPINPIQARLFLPFKRPRGGL